MKGACLESWIIERSGFFHVQRACFESWIIVRGRLMFSALVSVFVLALGLIVELTIIFSIRTTRSTRQLFSVDPLIK